MLPDEVKLQAVPTELLVAELSRRHGVAVAQDLAA
jgi:hypothetical protein